MVYLRNAEHTTPLLRAMRFNIGALWRYPAFDGIQK